MARNIAVIGLGYVGIIQAVGLADFGNTVIGVDVDETKVEKLSAGSSPIFEHDLEDYLRRNLQTGRLTFTTDISLAIQESEVIFIAVGTPSSQNGEVDLSQIAAVLKVLVKNLNTHKTIVTKSTVPVGTNRWIEDSIRREVARADFDVVSNPEFLREGKAIQDFFHPDRVVVGTESIRAREVIQDMYRPLHRIQTPIIWCNRETAELIKYASNGFLATKIAYINQISNIAEAVGADVIVVAKAMGMDGRIGSKFLHPGPGFGGSCFTKDLRAIVSMGNATGEPQTLAKEVLRANDDQKERIFKKLNTAAGGLEGKSVAVLGCAFKSETDDVRESPALKIIERILSAGAAVRVHDPKALDNLRLHYGSRVSYFPDVFDALAGAHACVILTEWNEYRNLDLQRAKEAMSGDVVVDGRNILDPADAKALGFNYLGVGRQSTAGQSPSVA